MTTKHDNLNCGHLRPEYLEELEKAQKDSYNHTVEISDGFKDWLNNAYDNQRAERKEVARRVWESMQPPKRELSDLDKAIHEAGEMRNYHMRKNEGKAHAESLLFTDSETDRRRSEIDNNRHPMDIAMRKQLEERKRQKGGF